MLRLPPSVGRGALVAFVCLAAHPRAARGQTPYKVAEGHLRIESIAAQAQPATPVVPKNTLSAVRVSVRAGDRELTAAEVAQSFGPGFKVQAELSGPGLTQTVTLPRPGDPVLPDPLLLVLPPLSRSGNYDLRGMRITAADGRAVLDVEPQATTLRVIEQVLITSVQTRPLTRDEIRDRGILLDNQAYLGFEFTLALRLESDQVDIRYPVIFDREGLPHPPTIPIPPLPSRSVLMPPLPTIVPMMLKAVPSGGGGSGGGGGGGGGDELGGIRIPSILVIPGNVGYLKQFFSAQLMVSNGAPVGSGLSVRNITAHIKLPPGPDLVPGNADDPLALAPLETGPSPFTLPVKGLGPDGEPGTPDDVEVLAPAQQGQAEFLIRGDDQGFHTLDFDIAAVLDGLPVGPRNIVGAAKGGVLVRNAYFDVSFTAPSVVRNGEQFKLYATLTNISQSAANNVKVSLDDRISGAHLVCAQTPCNGTMEIDTVAAGDAHTVEFLLESERTGEVVASYLKFQPGLQGRLTFMLGVGERGIPHSPDTLVLPASVDALPAPVVSAAMRVLGQAWSIAQAAPVQLPGQVARTDHETVQKKALALAEAGLRVQLGQPVAAAVRDLAFDFYGGAPIDTGFDQLLRTTRAGRDLAFALGVELAAPAGGNAPAYEQAVARVAASGPDAMTFAVRSAGDPVTASVADALGRRSEGARSLSLPLSEVPGAVFLPLGAPASASYLGVVTAPDKAPYTFTLSGPAELSVSYPRGGTRFSRATVTTTHAARVLVDFASGELAIDEDVDGDGDYEDHRTVAATDFAPEGARLLSANVVGPETLDGATALGLQVALLFDRLVDPESGADTTRYLVPKNSVAAARRQLSGRLVFASLRQPEGAYLASSVSASGIRDARGVEGPAVTVPLVSRVPDVGGVVSGRVVEADGHPLAGVAVRYNNLYSCASVDLTPVSDVTTDADGRYELRFVRQNECGTPFELAVWDPVTGARRSLHLSVRTAGERIVADIALLGRGSVTGIVRDAAGAPAPGAMVRVISVTDPDVGAVAQADGDGRYVVHDITVGAVNATAVLGLLVGRGAGVIAHAGGTATVDVRLEGQSARISGVVYKHENGHTTEAPGIPVLYYVRPSGSLVGFAYTDASGRYALEGMPAGDFTVTAMLNTRDKASVLYRADPGQTIEDLDIIVEVQPDSSLGIVRGTVRMPNGSAAPGVVVSIGNRGVVSGADGSYEITGLALPSNPQVVARTTDGLRTGSSYAVLTPQQPLAQAINITLSGMGRVEFTLLDPAGNPIVGQAVGLMGATCAADCGCSQSTTNNEGRVGWNVPLGTWGAKVVKWTNGKADVATGVAHLTQDGLTAFGVVRMAGFGNVSGVVLDAANNQPLHGAVVVLTANKFVQSEGCTLLSVVVGTRTTDTLGQFQFGAVNTGPVAAMATHPIVTGTVASGATLGAGQALSLTLRLSSTDTMAGELSGTVYEPDGTTHVGAGVLVTVNGVLPDVTVPTNADGVFRFAEVLPQGYYRLTARDTATGHVAGKSIYLRAGQDAAHDLRLLGRGTVVVKVVDGGGREVETAQVRMRGTEYPSRVYEGTVQPGMEGKVTLGEVVEGPYAVDVSDAFGRGGRASFVLPGPDETAEVKVTLTVVGTVQGHFLMPDGAPIPFGTVRLIAGGRTVGQITTAGSGDLGFFSFSYVPAGALRLEALDPATGRTGLAVGSLESEGQNVVLDIRAQALGTVQGVVTSNGVPEPGALVDIVSGTYRVSTAADPQGFYKVVGVPEGRPTVHASLPNGYLKATRSETLLGEGTVLTMDMALRPTGTVEGAVTEADGETPALAVVSLWASGVGGGTFVRPTSQSGEFGFERVASGKASISADEVGSIDRADAQIDVPEGATVQVPLRLNGVGSLRGMALGSGGAATAGMLWVQGSGPYRYMRVLDVGPNGFFGIPELMAGPVTLSLRVTSDGITLYGSASGTITADQETVLDVRLEPSGTVTGVVMRPGGTNPAFGADVTITHAKGTAVAQAQFDGRFTFKGVPLGPITVRIVDPITTGRATVRNRTVATNGEVVDLGTLVLDAAPPTVTPVDPLEGGSRTKLAAMFVVDLADVGSGLDTSTYGLRYASSRLQPASAFTFTNGRLQTLLDGRELVIGQNTLTAFVQDLAGNLTERRITFTVTGATARGTVRWPDGSPASAVQVTFDNATPVTTDADGHYVKTGLRGGSNSVYVLDPPTGSVNYQSAPIYDGEDTTVDVTLPGYGTIVGTVKRSNGSAAAGVTVSIGNRTTITTADGSFNLGAFGLNTYTVRATDANSGDVGEKSAELKNFRQVAQVPITLNGVGHVIVNVKNAAGAAVPNARVDLTSSSPVSPGYVLNTDSTGKADFPSVLAGTITAIAQDLTHGLAGQAGNVLAAGGTLTLNVTLAGAGTVTGTLRLPNGAPVVGLTVKCTPPNSNVVTNAQGAYTFQTVPLGTFQLSATAAGGDSASASGTLTTQGQTMNVDLTLHGTGAVNVEVRDSFGAPAPGAAVKVWPSSQQEMYAQTGTAGADGKVSFPAVLGGQVFAKASIPATTQWGQTTATLAAGSTLDMVVTLEPVGTIRGHVFRADGVTPAVDVEVSTEVMKVRSRPDGTYELANIPLSWYTPLARVNGRLRAEGHVQLSANGQVVTLDLVLHGTGTVTGVVTDPQGAAVSAVPVHLRNDQGIYTGDYNTTTDSAGRYSLADVPVGPFSIDANRSAQGQQVKVTGSVDADGQTVVLDLQLLASAVTLPLTLDDANTFAWKVAPDGAATASWLVGSTRWAPRLSLVLGGTPYSFTGGGTNGSSEENKRETVIRQTLAGVNVTRKAFVPVTGYFIRFVDLIENPSAQPVTVEAVYSSNLGDTPPPTVVETSSGDTVVDEHDQWLLLDDSIDADFWGGTMLNGQLVPLGIATYGEQGLPPISQTLQGRDLTQRWVLTIPAQGRVALMQVMTGQGDRARGRASVVRLGQLPPELLAGLSSDEGAAIANFVVPPDLTSVLPALPMADGVVGGRILAGDGVTLAPHATIRFRSRSLYYGRPFDQFDQEDDATYLISADPAAGKMMPREPFDLRASFLFFATQMTSTLPGDFATTGVRDITLLAGGTLHVSSVYPSNGTDTRAANAADRSLASKWQAATNDSTTRGTTPFFEVRLPAPATIHEVRIRGRRDPSSDWQTIRQARVEVRDAAAAVLWSTVVSMPPPPLFRDADVPVPAVPGASAVRIVDLLDGGAASLAEVYVMGELGVGGASHWAPMDARFEGWGALAGRVLRANGSPLTGCNVLITNGINSQNVTPDANAEYLVPVLPPGTYTLTASHAGLHVSATVSGVTVSANQTTVQDIVFPAFGALQGAFFTVANQPVNGTASVVVNGGQRVSNSSSTYRFDDLPPGTYAVTATDSRSSGQVTANVTVTANATLQQDFVFPPVGTVEVWAKVGTTPLPGATVQYRTPSRGNIWLAVGGPATDALGKKVIPNVPGPQVTVRVTHPDSIYSFGEASGTILEGQTLTLNVAVPGVGTVSGVLRTRNGVAIPNESVYALSASDSTQYGSATTNGSGAFQIVKVPAGPFRLRGQVIEGHGITTTREEADVAATLTTQGLVRDALAPQSALAVAGERHLWELPLDAGQLAKILLFGSAVGTSPALADTFLEVYGPDGQLAGSNDNRAAQDLNSEVIITAPDAGTYVVMARAAGSQTGGYHLGTYNGVASTLPFRPYVGATVQGVVTRQAGGAVVAGATVRLQATTAGGLTVNPSAVTNAAGAYSFADVPRDAAVTVSLFDGSGTVLTTVTGMTGAAGTTLDLPLVSPSMGIVEVRTLLGAQPYPGVTVTVTSDNPHATQALRVQQGITAADGRFTVAKAPGGGIVAQAVDPVTGGPMEATGTLVDGGTLSLELHLSESDQTPPAAVTNLTAFSTSVVRLTWTAPGDDGTTGTASAYDIRYATVPITAANFAAAASIPAPLPAAAGTVQTVNVSGLSLGVTYYFALRTRDESYNWSALSNVPSATLTLPVPGAKLWLRSDAGITTDGASDYVTAWADQSGNGNNATQSVASAWPLRIQGEANGLPVLRFDGSSDFLTFTTRLTTVRTVFWVIKETATTSARRGMLGDAPTQPTQPTQDFFAGQTRQIWATNCSPFILNGETRVNGGLVNGTTTNRPITLSAVTLVTSGNVIAGNFSKDGINNSYFWQGDLAELIIYDRVLGDDERRQIEDYLAARYALYAPPRRAPSISPNGGRFAEPVTVTLNGSSLVRYTLDGNDPTTSSEIYGSPLVVTPPVTVKARAYAADGSDPSPVSTVTFLSTAQFTPASVTGLKLWVRADAGLSGDASARPSAWADQSGLGNSLLQPAPWNQPVVIPNGGGTLPVLRFDGTNDALPFTTRVPILRTVFWVVRENASAPNAYRYLLGDSSGYPFSSGFQKQIWGAGYADLKVTGGETRLNGGLVNGTTTTKPIALSVISLITTGTLGAAGFSIDTSYLWWGDLAELIIYDTPLSSTDRRAVEEYLAARYSITLAP